MRPQRVRQEQTRAERQSDLDQREDLASVERVGDPREPDRREGERDERDQPDQADREHRVGDRIDLDQDGDVGDLVPDLRDEQPGEQEPVVAVALERRDIDGEGAEGAAGPAGPFDRDLILFELELL